MESSEERSDRRDVIGVGDDGKSSLWGCARVARTPRVFEPFLSAPVLPLLRSSTTGAAEEV